MANQKIITGKERTQMYLDALVATTPTTARGTGFHRDYKKDPDYLRRKHRREARAAQGKWD